MAKLFPRTEIEGISLSRMIIGTNWILGYSHTSPAADKLIRNRHSNIDNTVEMLKVFLNYGIDTIMGPFAGNPALCRAVKTAEDITGKKIIIVDTPILNMDDNTDARREAESVIVKSSQLGADFCLIHHSSAEQLVNKNKKTMDRLPDYLKMIRDHGMVPGLSAHMPELIIYSDENEYDVQTYVQLYNCMGFLIQIEVICSQGYGMQKNLS